MSAKYFIDTNIFVYCFDPSQPEKQSRAMELVGEALLSGDGNISWQVVQEFINVATRKFPQPFSPEDVLQYLAQVLHPLCRVFPDLEIYQSAVDISVMTHFSFYDALILAGAVRAGCEILYTEDLQTGQVIEGVKIQNPFTG
jgi:predicted nucleic acid-binding protein